MEDVDTEQRFSRKRRKLTTRQGVLIGIAAVAGLSVVTKLVSFWRQEKPKELDDKDVKSLETVASGETPQGMLAIPKFTNLEEDDAPQDADPDTDASAEDIDVETPHVNGGEHLVDNGDQEVHSKAVDAKDLHNGDAHKPIGDAETVPTEDIGKLAIEDVDRLPTAADGQELPAENGEKLDVDQLSIMHDGGDDGGELRDADANDTGTTKPDTRDAEKPVADDEAKESSEDAADAEKAEKLSNVGEEKPLTGYADVLKS